MVCSCRSSWIGGGNLPPSSPDCQPLPPSPADALGRPTHRLVLPLLATLLVPTPGAGGSLPQEDGRKLALIVAIADYGTPPPHPQTGEPLRAYRPLNANNDVPLISGALQVQGFAPEDIRVVQDGEADAEGIREAFRWLVREARTGDVVVFHYSGHGHRLTNDNPEADEEVDGYDELLVPHGAHEDFYEGYDGRLHIRDDELGEVLQELRRRVGPTGNVTFFIDACYSGTATRGDADLPARGTAEPMGPAALPDEGVPAAGGGGGAAPATRGGDTAADRGTGLELPEAPGTRGGQDGLAPYAVFSAASQRQVAYETYDVDGTTRVGSLSYALARTLPEAEPGTTYRSLFAKMARTLSGKVRQTPQVEGTVDTELFSGRLAPQRPYVTVDSVLALDGATGPTTVVVLGAGSLLGVNPGTRLAVHPVGTPRADPAAALALLEVREADPQSAAAVVVEGALDPSHAGSWAFVTTRSYGDLATRVRLAPGLRERDVEGLTLRLGELGIVEFVEEGAEVVVVPGDGLIQARTVQDDLLLARGAADVIQAVEAYARNRYLRRLEFDAPEIRVALDFAPAQLETDLLGRATGCAPAAWETAKAGPAHLGGDQWRMSLGDVYQLRVRNTGSRRAFIALLDLMPRGAIQVLRPREGESPNSYELEPGAALELGCYQLSDETGHEVLKLFATSAPQDFRGMFETRGTRSAAGGDLSALEEVVAASFSGTRSGEVGTPGGVATTVSVQIHVQPSR